MMGDSKDASVLLGDAFRWHNDLYRPRWFFRAFARIEDLAERDGIRRSDGEPLWCWWFYTTEGWSALLSAAEKQDINALPYLLSVYQATRRLEPDWPAYPFISRAARSVVMATPLGLHLERLDALQHVLMKHGRGFSAADRFRRTARWFAICYVNVVRLLCDGDVAGGMHRSFAQAYRRMIQRRRTACLTAPPVPESAVAYVRSLEDFKAAALIMTSVAQRRLGKAVRALCRAAR